MTDDKSSFFSGGFIRHQFSTVAADHINRLGKNVNVIQQSPFRKRFLVLLVFLTILFSSSHGFNLETRVPIVKFGGTYNDSYFGYSVAQHVTGAGEPVILVGAPRDKNLQPGTNRTGALYKCALSLSTDDCVQVETDGRRHVRGPYYGMYDGSLPELMPPVASEIKEDQWLGVSLQSQGVGGKVLVCAHRYTVRDEYARKPIDSKRGVLGMCYILNSDLTLPQDTSIGARNVLVIREALRGKRLELVKDFDNHAVYGACQVGTSVSWIHEDDVQGDYALFGAPGCFTWRGNLLAQKTGSSASYETAVRQDNNLEYTKHGHLGLSVTSGRYFDGELQYAAGAPHVNGREGSGEIYFYTRNVADARLESETGRKLTGGSFGAGFGYSLETLDVNGDDLDDLLVGAPFTDNEGQGGGGAVYLYINGDKGLQSSRYLKLEGSAPESQFGLALARLGDINKDGFDDFAVGAPYEDQGVVYIFLGSTSGVAGMKAGKISDLAANAASQIISGQALAGQGSVPMPQNLKTFGSSLSGGGIDLDGNSYPDLVVGAFDANAAYLLLSRPIINISTRIDDSKLQAIDPGQAGCEHDPQSSYTCFQFSACFRLDSLILDSKSAMKIKFKILAEPNKLVSRVWLRIEDELTSGGADSDDVKKNKIEHTLLIQEQGRDYCTSMIGYLSNTHTDLQTPVKFALSYTLVQDEPRVQYNSGQPMIKVNQYPILNQQQALRTFYAKFEKNCGDDDLCQAQLVVQPKLMTTQGEELRRGTQDGGNGQGIYQLELGTLPENQIVLDLNVQNLGEAAYESKLDITFPDHIYYVGLGSNNSDTITDITLVNSTFITINLGNPFRGRVVSGDGQQANNTSSSSLNLQMRFSPASVINETLITFELMSSTTSELVVDALTFLNCVVVRRAELKVTGRSLPADHVYYGGQVRGESALKDLSEIGPMVHHRYLVSNHGPSEVDVVTVKIKWPHQVENYKPQGKWLLYLTEHPYLKNGRGDCTVPAGYPPNPLNLTRKLEAKSRIGGYNTVDRSLDINNAYYSDISDNSNMYYNSAQRLFQSSQDLNQSEVDQFSYQQQQERRRARREIEHIVAAQRVWRVGASGSGDGEENTTDDDSQLVVKLDCDRGTAKCLTITCQVYNLPARDSVTVEIKARLWNSTLVEDYSDVDRVEIYSKSTVIIDSVYTQDPSNDHESILTVALPDRQLEPKQPPAWWIYILSAAIGLLLLVIIVLLLAKVGFFQRTRPQDEDDDSDFMVSANFEKVKLNGSNGIDSL